MSAICLPGSFKRFHRGHRVYKRSQANHQITEIGIKALEIRNRTALVEGETIKIILGNRNSLKSVAQELKTRGMKPGFQQEDEKKLVFTVGR